MVQVNWHLVRETSSRDRYTSHEVIYSPTMSLVPNRSLFVSLIVELSDIVSLLVQHFYAEPRAAKEILGWKGTTNLPEDLKERFEEYVKIGRDKKPMEFPTDDKILESTKVPVAV